MYKAEIALATEKYYYNPKTGECEGTDPDSYEDHGVIDILTALNLGTLKSMIAKRYFNLENPIGADVQICDGVIEIVCDSDTHKDQLDRYSIMIFKVETTTLDLSNEPLFKGINKNA